MKPSLAGRAVISCLLMFVLPMLTTAQSDPSNMPAVSSLSALGGGIAAVSVRHELLGNPLVGAHVRARVPLGNGRLGLRVSVEDVSGHARRAGDACAGLQPAPCPVEQIRDDARLRDVALGVAVPVRRGSQLEVALTADVSLDFIHAESRGLTTDQSLTATKLWRGGFVGTEVAWLPWSGTPVAVEVEASVGRLAPFVSQTVADGYTPFEAGAMTSRARVGVAWRLHSRAH